MASFAATGHDGVSDGTAEREIARKDARRIEMALKLVHFPMVRDLTRLRLWGAALHRRQTSARSHGWALDRQWRECAAARIAWRRQNPSRRQGGSSGCRLTLGTPILPQKRSCSATRPCDEKGAKVTQLSQTLTL